VLQSLGTVRVHRCNSPMIL